MIIDLFDNKQRLLTSLTVLSLFFFASCGIEKHYFLPQVPQERILHNFDTEATVELAPIDLTQFYYAQNYSIYYKIYISDHIGGISFNDPARRTLIHPELERDFNIIFPSTDPTNLTANTAVNNLFNTRGYYELELIGANIKTILSTSGGTVKILFPTDPQSFPVLSVNGGTEYHLSRSASNLIRPEPIDGEGRFEPSFRNSDELNDHTKATPNINADVASRNFVGQRHAFVSMYVVAVGMDSVNFSPIYSKPTHINVFKLPD